MKLKITLAVLTVLLILGGLAGTKGLQFKTMIAAPKVQPPESVSAVVAQEERWPATLTAIGSINAAQGVTLTPDIPGTVREIAFESGAVVKKGDLLVRLDISSEQAQLRAIEAQLELAQINLGRTRKLRADNTVAQAELDTAEATLKQGQANADNIRATIEKKTIRAPFAGRLGIRQINLGQYLDAGKPIVSLQSLQPVYADFSLPQRDVARLQNGLKVRVTTDAYSGRVFEGALTAINPELDASTRTLALQATFENADQALRPGMFARVEVLLPEEHNLLVLPATAVLSSPSGDSVFVIENKPSTNLPPGTLTVRQQFIRTGRTRGDYVSVTTGLKPGERVASSGVFKLRNGTPVIENNELAPKASTTPQPADS